MESKERDEIQVRESVGGAGGGTAMVWRMVTVLTLASAALLFVLMGRGSDQSVDAPDRVEGERTEPVHPAALQGERSSGERHLASPGGTEEGNREVPGGAQDEPTPVDITQLSSLAKQRRWTDVLRVLETEMKRQSRGLMDRFSYRMARLCVLLAHGTDAAATWAVLREDLLDVVGNAVAAPSLPNEDLLFKRSPLRRQLGVEPSALDDLHLIEPGVVPPDWPKVTLASGGEIPVMGDTFDHLYNLWALRFTDDKDVNATRHLLGQIDDRLLPSLEAQGADGAVLEEARATRAFVAVCLRIETATDQRLDRWYVDVRDYIVANRDSADPLVRTFVTSLERAFPEVVEWIGSTRAFPRSLGEVLRSPQNR